MEAKRQAETWETLDQRSTVFEALCRGLMRDGAPGGGWFDLYINLCDLAGQLLEEVRAGRSDYEAVAYRLVQEQVPYARRMAGYAEPYELEADLRERYRIPEPAANAPGFDPAPVVREEDAVA